MKTLSTYHKIFLVMMILSVSSLFVGIGLSPVTTRGEAREAQVVKAMIANHSIQLPLRNDSIVPSKPPMYHLISYGFSTLLPDRSVMALRLPSLIASILSLVLVYSCVSWGSYRLYGAMTVLVMFSSIDFIRHATIGRVDAIFALFFLLSLISLVLIIEDRISRKYLLSSATALFLFCSVLSKGPFGLILPVSIALIYGVLSYKEILLRRSILIPFITSILLASTCGGIWYYITYLSLGDRFLEVQLFKENLARVLGHKGVGSSEIDLGHAKPFYFSIIYLLLATSPWILFLPRIVSSIKIYVLREGWHADRVFRISVISTILFLFIVTISASKRSAYFLPVIPAASYLFIFGLLRSKTQEIHKGIGRFEKTIIGLVLSIFIFALFFQLATAVLGHLWGIDIIAFLVSKAKNGQSLHGMLSLFSMDLQLSLILFACAMICLKLFLILDREPIEHSVLCLATLVCIGFGFGQLRIAPIISSYKDPAPFVREVDTHVGEAPIYQFNDEYYATVYTLNRTAPFISDLDATSRIHSVFFLLASVDDFAMLQEKGANDYELLEITRSAENLANKHGPLVLAKVVRRTTL